MFISGANVVLIYMSEVWPFLFFFRGNFFKGLLIRRFDAMLSQIDRKGVWIETYQ